MIGGLVLTGVVSVGLDDSPQRQNTSFIIATIMASTIGSPCY